MKYKAIIEDVETGETVEFEGVWHGDEHSLWYIWADGNYECDCNRSRFFFEAQGLRPLVATCGESLYRVPYLVLEDGSKMEIDE